MARLKALSESTVLTESSIQNTNEADIKCSECLRLNKDYIVTLCIDQNNKLVQKEYLNKVEQKGLQSKTESYLQNKIVELSE